MLKTFNRLLAFAAALFMGVGGSAEAPTGQETLRRTAPPTVGGDQNAVIERAVRRRTLALARQAAAERAKPAREAAKAARATKTKAQAMVQTTKLPQGYIAPPGIMNPLGTPDYMGGVVPNYANSPLIRKFVDTLPGLGAANANNLGTYIPIAIPDTTTYPGSDYYKIGVVNFTHQFNSDLPATHLRGYKDLNPAADGAAHYLGPVIIAQRDRPVRAKLVNMLPTGAAGNLPIPTDPSLMGAGPGPGGSTFTQNRALFHLHGGLSPWISDGTPHQWVTPAGEATANKKGVAFRNVPDMIGVDGVTDTPGDGIGTYYWTNQQSGRFMFYHDHSFGLTRLNVYMGEAAGYLIVDPVETKLINDGILPNNGGDVYNYGIPLIFQDKTFVPGPSDLAYQDPTWDTANWGGYGDLWFPHVYMPNQNPDDPSGANAMGRWDYGPWFWPPVPVADAPNSIPTAHGPVPGANPGDPTYPGTPNPSLTPEAFMDTPVVNGTAYPKLTVEPKAYRFRLLNASNDRPFGLAFYEADPLHPTEVKMVDASPAEAALAAAAGLVDGGGVSLWPTDGRAGGVVDWRTIGPDIIQIGNESGFLPAPVRWKSQATTYNYNRRDIVVLDVANHPLFLAPAERADVIVDFSAWAGKTLILYNDMLAPVPAFDVRYDYFTGAPDQTPTGGAPSTLEGYGPNTRTLMQVVVANTAPAPAFNYAALETAFASTNTSNGAFAATQHPPIVPQTFYNTAMNQNVAADTYATIQAYELPYTKTENGQPVVMPLQPKAIQELFELDYGRMNATLGVELPFTNFNNQTTIPLGYSELATEILADGQTQLWKVTHNGVDTHPVHFHLMDVQVVNRVGWDGAVRFPEANELGWKETVRMKPLEDIIVAFRPISPVLPPAIRDGMTNSLRVLNPVYDNNALVPTTDLSQTAINMGNLGAIINVPNNNTGNGYDYGWEYVWHCHILGHEENDFMRAMVLKVATTVPAAPSALTGTVNGPTRVDLAWTKNALPPNPTPADGIAVPVDETGFRVERSLAGANTFAVVGTTVPDQTNFTDFTVVSGTSYDYRVFSYNQKGDSVSAATLNGVTPGAVTAPVSVSLDALPAATAVKGTPITFTALGVSNPAGAAFEYQFLVNGAIVQNYSATATYSFPLTQAVGVYTVDVNARTSPASAVVSNSLVYTITPGPATGVQLLPNLPSPQASTKIITFTATGIGSTNYQYQFSVDGTVVQAYSTNNNYTLAAGLVGTHAIKVDVTTATPAVTADATATMNFTFNGARISGTTYVAVPYTPLSGATVTFSNGGGTATTDASGNYTIEVPLGWSGTATPTLAHYSFAPVTRTYTNLTTNQSGQNYRGTAFVVVSGQVTSAGAPKQGVTITFSNGGGSAITDASGNYSMNVAAGWSGTSTASLAGYTFSAPYTYSNLATDQPSQNFTVTGINVTGQAYVATNPITPVSGVVLTLSTGGTVTTDASGFYTAVVAPGWTGTITPSLAGWGFTPGSRAFTNVLAPIAGMNFRLSPRVTGTVTLNGTPLGDVLITFSNGGGSTTTNGSGVYTQAVPLGWSGTATASLNGYTFSGPLSFTNVTTAQVNQNFAVTGVPLSGRVYFASNPISPRAGVTVSLSTGQTTTTNASGNFTLTVPLGWSGTLTYSGLGYTYTPATRTFTNVQTAITGLNSRTNL
ncbi:MAG: multicopper oxidase domain-containing protein [Holophagaceae bacterium]